jgi:hypothetical protein
MFLFRLKVRGRPALLYILRRLLITCSHNVIMSHDIHHIVMAVAASACVLNFWHYCTESSGTHCICINSQIRFVSDMLAYAHFHIAY